MSINLDYLANFIIAAEYRSFTNAAERLFINQSTLSRQMQALEESLHTPLFIRNGKNLSLTRAGQVLYETGQTLLLQAGEVQKMVQDAANYENNRITIFSIPAVVEGTAEAQRILQSRGFHPDIIIHHLQSEDTQALLSSNTVDFLITYSSYIEERSLSDCVRIPFSREGFCAVCAPDHPLAQHKSVTFRECLKQNVLFGLGFPGLLPHAVAEPGDSSNPGRTLESYHDSVLLGEGILVLPSCVARGFASDLSYIPISDPNMRYNIELVYKKHRPFSPVCRAYAEAIREVGRRVFETVPAEE